MNATRADVLVVLTEAMIVTFVTFVPMLSAINALLSGAQALGNVYAEWNP